ncbi:hypothetical protein DFJ74DRAFT_514662 [Hyaloraphidium curvatum]|nr:hypothetical protein DFJ74DRAFT_514662 [Hyaloraphidium curvatum]
MRRSLADWLRLGRPLLDLEGEEGGRYRPHRRRARLGCEGGNFAFYSSDAPAPRLRCRHEALGTRVRGHIGGSLSFLRVNESTYRPVPLSSSFLSDEAPAMTDAQTAVLEEPPPASLLSLPDELLVAVTERLDRPARYSLIRTCHRCFRVALPLLYARRVKLSQRTIPAELVDPANPRASFYSHAIRKAWLLFSQADEDDVAESDQDRVLAFIDRFGHNLVSLVVMARLPDGAVPWFEEHSEGNELPDEYEPTLYFPVRVALALQRCVNVASLDFVGLRFTALTLLAPFVPSARHRHRTGLGSVSGIRELGFERCSFEEDIMPHHLASFSERLSQLGGGAAASAASELRARTRVDRRLLPYPTDCELRDSGYDQLDSFDRLSIAGASTDSAPVDYDEELPTWKENPETLLTVRRNLARSSVPLPVLYALEGGKAVWALPTPLEPPPKQLRSLALIRNLGIDMARMLCILQGGWCRALDELILLCLGADDADLQCIASVCPFLSRLDVGLDERATVEGVRALVGRCEGLVELYLDNARGEFLQELPEDAILEISRAHHVECLWLPECTFSPRVGDALAAMPHLRDLKFSGWPTELDFHAVLGLSRSRSLQRLEVTVFYILEDGEHQVIEALVAMWTTLKASLARENPAITTEFLVMHLTTGRWETTQIE